MEKCVVGYWGFNKDSNNEEFIRIGPVFNNTAEAEAFKATRKRKLVTATASDLTG